MIDVHTHILPGVDDGSPNMEESLKIIKNGIAEGIKGFILTPHIRDDSDWEKIDIIKKCFSDLKNECSANGLDVHLILGAEFLINPNLPDRLKVNREFAFGGDRRYVLVELPFSQFPVYAEDVIYKLLISGVVPIIAHPERYSYLKEEQIKKWIESGIMMQLNAGSLNRKYGFMTKWTAKKLLKGGYINLLGSDVHSASDKYCSFNKAVDTVGRMTNVDRILRTAETLIQ